MTGNIIQAGKSFINLDKVFACFLVKDRDTDADLLLVRTKTGGKDRKIPLFDTVEETTKSLDQSMVAISGSGYINPNELAIACPNEQENGMVFYNLDPTVSRVVTDCEDVTAMVEYLEEQLCTL